MRACPKCGDPLSIHGVCGSCDYGRAKPKAENLTRPEPHRMTPEAKANYEAGGPRSHDLTPQQWYNVCKFWPFVAVHCKRSRPGVGPHNELDKTSRKGPLFPVITVDAEAKAEREAIQSEP